MKRQLEETMLAIRDDMFHALAEGAYQEFVVRVRAHLRTHFPETCDSLGEPKLTQFIDFGVRRARGWGFENEPDVVQFIDLMCVFGHQFDRNPRLPWARQVLASNAPPNPALRMRRLQEEAQKALLPTGGRRQ